MIVSVELAAVSHARRAAPTGAEQHRAVEVLGRTRGFRGVLATVDIHAL
jgi:hypothetical protein